MSDVKIQSLRYTVDPLFQWDVNQVLTIKGLSLATVPKIHFALAAKVDAVVCSATMGADGVIRSSIPNTLLQSSGNLEAYVCIYEGDTFESLYKIVIPVKARPRPADYGVTIGNYEDEIVVSAINALPEAEEGVF